MGISLNNVGTNPNSYCSKNMESSATTNEKRLTELGQNMVDIQTITRDFGVNSGVL